MNTHPLAEHWMFLCKAPFYTPVFLSAPECREPLLAMRVEELHYFYQQFYRTTVRFTAWCGLYETWVVAFPFRIDVCRDFRLEGVPCLNPRNVADAEIIQKFARHEIIHFWLLNADLSDFVTTEVLWPKEQHRHVSQLLTEVDQTLLGDKLISAFDPDFERAKREFQTLYTVEHLLQVPAQTRDGVG
jgi:hypothetical protein